MRLLSIRPDHECSRASCAPTESDRCGNRQRDAWESVPVRHLSVDSRCHSPRRAGRCAMSRALSRRGFIQVSAAATGGLLLGLSLPLRGAAQSAAGAPKLNAFVKIGTDDVITLIIHKPENGQG